MNPDISAFAMIALLIDAARFAQAAEIGCDLLTGNVRDFDGSGQLIPGSGLLLYRAVETA